MPHWWNEIRDQPEKLKAVFNTEGSIAVAKEIRTAGKPHRMQVHEPRFRQGVFNKQLDTRG